MANETHSFGTERTYRSPSRTGCVDAHGVGCRWSSAGRIINKHAITARYDTASMVKHHLADERASKWVVERQQDSADQRERIERDVGEPVAAVGNGLADEQQAEVAVAQ